MKDNDIFAGKMILFPADLFAKLQMLIDPPPMKRESDGATMVLKNPMAAEVLTMISAIVRSVADDQKKPASHKFHIAQQLDSLAQQIYQSWESQPGFAPWIDGGNSAKQNEARQIASRTFELALANQVER